MMEINPQERIKIRQLMFRLGLTEVPADTRAGHAGINQCDGCQRGLPMRYSRVSPSSKTPIHYDPDGGYAVMACTKDLYK